jgi:ParB family chromosome partitioning protein
LAKQFGLGKGLGALIPDPDPVPIVLGPATGLAITGEAEPGFPAGSQPSAGGEAAQSQGGILRVPLGRVEPNPDQPRKTFSEASIAELADSLKRHGLIQPIVVEEAGEGRWRIVAGERRWRAAQAAQLHEVPVVIREMADRDALEVALVENIQRQDLTAIEEADGYRRLMDEFGHTQEALSKALGKSRPHIANQLRLLTLPKTVKDFINEGALSAGHARTLIGAPDPESLAIKIVAEGLSVREAEDLAKNARPTKKGGSAPRKGAVAKDADTLAIERELGALLGLNVDIAFKNGGGKLTIHYKTLDQLDEVLRRISQGNGKPPVS